MGDDLLFRDLPNQWEEISLGEACRRGGGDIQTGPFGSQLHASDYVAQGIPSVMPKNIGENRIDPHDIARITPEDAERLSRYLLKDGDIVYSRRGDVERRALVTKKEDGWLCGTGCLRVRLGEKGIDPKYASFYLAHPRVRKWILRHAHGATMANLNTSILSECPFLVPPQNEQHAIAEILGTLDDKIELIRQMNRTLEAMARAIFKAWFVDFEPVKAKVAGATSFRGMPQAVFDQLPDRLTETELGPLPEGWTVNAIGSIASISRDSISPSNSPDEVFEHFSIPAFDAGMSPARDFGSSIKSNKYVVSPNCVLVSKLNPRFARVWLPDKPSDGARQICSTEFLVVTPKEGWTREQLYCQFVEDGFRNDLEKRASGTSNSHQRIKPPDFEKTNIVAPPVNERETFVDSVGPLFAKAANGHREAQILAAIRDTLLPKLISGELRVPIAEETTDGR